MLNLLPWRRRMRLPRAKKDLVTLSGLSGRAVGAGGGVRSSGTASESTEVMEEAGERKDDAVEEVVVVLLRERPLKTDRRRGLGAWAVERERAWTGWSGESLEPLVEGRSGSGIE
jgi:hypothetical protein